MTQSDIVFRMAKFIANRNDYFKDVRRGFPAPVSQMLCNPGLLTAWSRIEGDPYPISHGYVDFVDGAERIELGHTRGWSALQYICRLNLIKRGLSLRDFFCGKYNGYTGYVRQVQSNRVFCKRNDRCQCEACDWVKAAQRHFGVGPDTVLSGFLR